MVIRSFSLNFLPYKSTELPLQYFVSDNNRLVERIRNVNLGYILLICKMRHQ